MIKKCLATEMGKCDYQTNKKSPIQAVRTVNICYQIKTSNTCPVFSLEDGLTDADFVTRRSAEDTVSMCRLVHHTHRAVEGHRLLLFLMKKLLNRA